MAAAGMVAAACIFILCCILVLLTWVMAFFFPARAQQPSEKPREERARQGEARAKEPLGPASEAEQRDLWPAGSSG